MRTTLDIDDDVLAAAKELAAAEKASMGMPGMSTTTGRTAGGQRTAPGVGPVAL